MGEEPGSDRFLCLLPVHAVRKLFKPNNIIPSWQTNEWANEVDAEGPGPGPGEGDVGSAPEGPDGDDALPVGLPGEGGGADDEGAGVREGDLGGAGEESRVQGLPVARQKVAPHHHHQHILDRGEP